MSWLVGLLIGWFLMRWVQSMKEDDEPKHQPEPMPTSLSYGFDSRLNWALCLAHPMAVARVRSGFASPNEVWPRDEVEHTIRPAVLHLFGLRSDMTDAQIQSALNNKLTKRWFCVDLDALRPQDDARDALAFACARVAFATRVAGAMGWIDDSTQVSVLLQNAQRANDCFADWRDFGTAWARGRRQWVAASRADSLGVSFDAERVEQWQMDPKHPWSALPWQVPPLFVPPAAPVAPASLNPQTTPSAV